MNINVLQKKLIVCFAVFIVACKVQNNLSGEPCVRKTIPINLLVENKSYGLVTLAARGLILDSVPIQWLETDKFSPQQLDDFINAVLEKQTPRIKDIYFANIYFDSIFYNNNTLSSNNIKAVSVYTIIKRKAIKFQFFTKISNEFKEVKALTCKTYRIPSSTFLSVPSTLVFQNQKSFSFIKINKNVYDTTLNIYGTDNVENTLKNYCKKQNIIYKEYP